MAVAIAITANTTHASTASDPITYTSLASGTASADRITVVAFSQRTRIASTGVTINGITATKAHSISHAASSCRAEIWYAANPSGTTATVVITFGASTASVGGISMFAVTGADTTPTDTDSASSDAGPTATISALTIPSNGGAILCGGNGDETTGMTWANATEYQDANATTYRVGSAYTTTAGTPSITLTGTAANFTVMVGAAWSETVAGGQPAVKRMAGVNFANQVSRNFSIW